MGTVRKVADMGYDAVQFAGFFGTPASVVKRTLNEKGIRVAGSHTGLDLLTDDKLKETILYNKKINNDLLICPYLPEEKRNSRDAYQRTAEQFNEIGRICQQNGMRFAYHNHNFEFETFSGVTGFELLFGETDTELVKMELDCFWANYAGYRAESIIEKYGNRVVSLHMKDMNQGKKSIEIGAGTLDIAGLIHTAKNQGVSWLVVEQEDFDRDPMDCAKTNQDNLRTLLTTN
ncbi:sugar phosphate isomerase/epimerase family protein [Virgibacillus phasianinus]|uniref:sugar phosphate isomerase/epimerase family protein n=1 Tax=Virgibacillus phasianinus TaxID=2017483 RepID=UPI001560BB18|nr:sugar phosphate isomerase/epimerase [Virgibacillus phasianinus]